MLDECGSKSLSTGDCWWVCILGCLFLASTNETSMNVCWFACMFVLSFSLLFFSALHFTFSGDWKVLLRLIWTFLFVQCFFITSFVTSRVSHQNFNLVTKFDESSSFLKKKIFYFDNSPTSIIQRLSCNGVPSLTWPNNCWNIQEWMQIDITPTFSTGSFWGIYGNWHVSIGHRLTSAIVTSRGFVSPLFSVLSFCNRINGLPLTCFSVLFVSAFCREENE